MSRLWSRALEWLGRARVGRLSRTDVRVGQQNTTDAQGGGRWRDYLSAEKLYDAWGPHPESPWSPFHCVPLFAAVDRIPRTHIWPAPETGTWERWIGQEAQSLPPHARYGARGPNWAESDSAIFLDLPGPLAVEAAAWLVTSAGCQPICTFDNWPHPKGILRPEDTLATLLSWAAIVDDARLQLGPTSPPVWVCDSERLGIRPGTPGQFDNRYYLDDSVLPGPRLLSATGIARIVYVTYRPKEIPVLDLEGYFADLLAAGIPVLHVELSGAEPGEPQPLASPVKPRPLNRTEFRRSAAGGFGSEVPEPSSGGGG